MWNNFLSFTENVAQPFMSASCEAIGFWILILLVAVFLLCIFAFIISFAIFSIWSIPQERKEYEEKYFELLDKVQKAKKRCPKFDDCFK